MRRTFIGSLLWLALLAMPLTAQWLNYPTAGIPRTKDGKPNLISFEFKNGMYVVNKVLEDGYLSIGKQRLDFRREE